jgi:hypothetical protein
MAAESDNLKPIASQERQRVMEAFAHMKLTDERAKDVLDLAKSYRTDAEHFYEMSDYLSAFELYVYIFGMLDALARMKMLDPGKARKHFKIEQ